jgi:hypothetical protein
MTLPLAANGVRASSTSSLFCVCQIRSVHSERPSVAQKVGAAFLALGSICAQPPVCRKAASDEPNALGAQRLR